MIMLYNQMDGLVNVYTMDHRGTGRSTLFDCVAAQSTVSGSPSGGEVSVDEVPACAAALEDKYGSDLSCFSVTSAAADVSTFISTFTAGEQTFVYGVSYGTALVERLIHIAPDEVVGFILDGIATASGSSLANVEYFSKWDSDFGEVADGFLAKCADDAFCSAKFADQSLPDTLSSLIESFDSDPNSTCAALVRDLTSGVAGFEVEPASYTLRKTLGSLFMDEDSRTLIPALAYRLARCNADDVDVLTYFMSPKESQGSAFSEDDKFESTLLYGLIVYSEMWESPQPSETTMLRRFTDYSVTNGGTYSSIDQYCAFSKEDSAVCNTYDVGDYTASGIIYERDAYWNEPAEIPSQASVLLMSSKMDPQTPHKYAEYLLDALDGSAKELVTFEHATHGTLWTTPLSSSSSTTCGLLILASYVTESGDLSSLDKSCMSLIPDLSFEVPELYQHYYLSTDDAYDGAYDASLGTAVASSASASGPTASSSAEASTASSGSSSTYKTLFIVFLVLFVLAAVAGGVVVVRWCRRRQREVYKPSELPTQASIPTPAPGSSYPFVNIQGGLHASP
jgi:pimeloyl-ACP methyl ester carboxylesterase